VYIKPLVKYRFNPNIQSYVDEYEWGVNVVPADGVNSYCRANWRNLEKTGTVYLTCEHVAGQEW